MELSEYQKKAMQTCMKSSENFSYMMLNLVGEVGEFASKMAKAIRKEEVEINENHFPFLLDDPLDEELKLEAGDIMWQLFGLIEVLGWDAEEIAQLNLEKLKSRKERKVINGEGDYR